MRAHDDRLHRRVVKSRAPHDADIVRDVELFPDDRPLLAALRAAGLETEVVSWDDAAFDW